MFWTLLKDFDCKMSKISAVLGSFLRRVKIQESADFSPFLTLIGAGGIESILLSGEPSRVLKILVFFKNDVGPRIKKSF